MNEHGFTLTEVLVGCLLMIAIGGGILATFEHVVVDQARQTKMQAAAQTARQGLDEATELLRNAGPIGTTDPASRTLLRIGGLDVVFNSRDWPARSRRDTGPHVARLCVDPASDTLWFDGQYTATGTWDPGTACPSTRAGWTHLRMARDVLNDAADPAFAAATDGRAVTMTLAVQAGTRAQPRTARLQSAAVPRGLAATAPTAPDGTAIDANDLLVRCNPDGSALLDLAVGFDAEGNPLKATYAQDGVALDALGGAVTVRPTAAGQRSYSIRATVTNVLGLTTVLTKGFTC